MVFKASLNWFPQLKLGFRSPTTLINAMISFIYKAGNLFLLSRGEVTSSKFSSAIMMLTVQAKGKLSRPQKNPRNLLDRSPGLHGLGNWNHVTLACRINLEVGDSVLVIHQVLVVVPQSLDVRVPSLSRCLGLIAAKLHVVGCE